jgi:hypothetical protein
MLASLRGLKGQIDEHGGRKRRVTISTRVRVAAVQHARGRVTHDRPYLPSSLQIKFAKAAAAAAC